MTKSKWPQVEENLILVERWMRDGLTEDQVCTNLGISVATLNKFKKQHIELAKALKKGRDIAVTEVENALFKRALGFEYEELKTSIRMVDGVETKFTEKIRKYALPDVAACFILLKNKDRERGWADNPIKMELERQIFEFHKKMEEEKSF